MKEAQIRSVALFFFYAFIDKELSFKATIEAVHLFEKKLKKKEHDTPVEPLLVASTYKVWKKYAKKRNIKTENLNLPGEGWVVPVGLKLEPWRQFVKESDSQIYLVVIWSQFLQLTDKNISEGLGVSEGSVRYRIGRGLKNLGQVVGPGAMNA